ncbi:MAG: efflux RND transporter periplasmic adaptor subunit [Saprospiraceae bacterium]|nr:efflux RND transporter periplasmic adaptor subunit [Saprospiraceae bacterium]MBP7699195.1 efflux RND transporter periplasmic adaptor subunit [Saprospiraceae bacterium]
MKKRTIYIIAGILALLIGLAAIKNAKKPKGEGVRVEKAQKRTIREVVSASGKIYPEKEVKISSDVSGEVVELYVHEGDSVVKGQLLARINAEQYQSAMERGEAGVNTSRSQLATARAGLEGSRSQKIQAEAQLEQVQAQLENIREIHNRNEQLFKDGFVSKADLDASLATLRQTQGSVRAAQAAVKAAETQVESNQQNIKGAEYSISSANATLKELRTSFQRTSIFAPVSGIISKLNIEKGERVVGTIQMAGTEMMRIANFSSMEVRVDVNENDVLRVSLGDTTEIEVDAYLGRKFKGVVTEIASSSSNIGTTVSSITDQVTNFIVRVRIDPNSYSDLVQKGKPYPFRPGMSASVDIITDVQKDVLAVPIQAVTTRDEKNEEKEKKEKAENRNNPVLDNTKAEAIREVKEVVFLMRTDTVALQEVKSGIQDDNYIQILSGVKEGDEVVSGPYTAVSRTLKQGAKVHIMKDDEENKDTKED